MTAVPLSDEQHNAIRAREQAATPGPWWADSHEIYSGPHGIPALGEWVAETCVAGELERSEANARFVAAARADVPALLAEVDRLRAELATARAQAITAKAAGYRLAADNAAEQRQLHGHDADAEMLVYFLQNCAGLHERFAADQAARTAAADAPHPN